MRCNFYLTFLTHFTVRACDGMAGGDQWACDGMELTININDNAITSRLSKKCSTYSMHW